MSSRPAGKRPALATIPGGDAGWTALVEDYTSDSPGSMRDLWGFLRKSRGRDVVILNGSVGRAVRYRDLLAAILLKHARLTPPRILLHDATWEPTSRALAEQFPVVQPLLPTLAKLAIRSFDGPHVRYAVLSTAEVATFPQVWGVDRHRVVFQPFPHTLHEYVDMSTTDEGHLFGGGNSIRDSGLLEEVIGDTSHRVELATSWTPSRRRPTWQVGVLSHDEFMRRMAASRAVVVPLRRTTRSGGQQTYLNAMALRKPVIVTDAPGVRDYVVDGVTGHIVCGVEELRERVEHVMDPSSAEENATMGARAREDVLARFTEKTFREGLLHHAGLARGVG